MKDVPYIVYESEMARLERIIKRQFFLVVIALCFLVGTNICWIAYENSFEDSVTVTQEAENGHNNYIGDDGDIINGEADH